VTRSAFALLVLVAAFPASGGAADEKYAGDLRAICDGRQRAKLPPGLSASKQIMAVAGWINENLVTERARKLFSSLTSLPSCQNGELILELERARQELREAERGESPDEAVKAKARLAGVSQAMEDASRRCRQDKARKLRDEAARQGVSPCPLADEIAASPVAKPEPRARPTPE
jgi:hypothetical protein